MLRKIVLGVCVAVSVCATWSPALAEKELCMYVSSDGGIHQVNGRSNVPIQYRDVARCLAETQGSTHLAQPDEIDLGRSVRKVNMSSSLGPISLRWDREAERLFNRTPERAMADAARAVSRALKGAGFPTALRDMHLEFNVVFINEELPETQIPTYLVNACHPAWMTPPANIYVVAQRVVAGCSGGSTTRSVGDAQLAEVLVHELGHVVEYYLLENKVRQDRVWAEGFATWFEQYAADYSSVIRSGAVKKEHFDLAKRSFELSPGSFRFQGSAYDYARVSMYFHAVVSRRNVRGLIDIYDTMKSERKDFLTALQDRMGWSDKKTEEEVQRVLR